jgi:adenylate kinase family enzyme
MREVLGHMFQSVFDFHLRALRFFQASKWKQLFKAHVFHNNFTDIIDGLRQHKELVERQASLVEFEDARQARIASQKHHQDMQDQERLRRRWFMRDWLDAPNTAERQEKGHATREARPDSGRWLLSRDRIKAWLDPSMSVSPCLWVHGIPGAGKTVLASLLVEICQTNTHAKTIYFYCRHGDRRSDNFISMSRSFLDQLSNLDSSVVDLLYDMAVKNDLCFKTRKATEDLLSLCLDAAGTLFIILDGLDECAEPEQKAIARWLRNYVGNSGGTVDPSRCVFLSQDDSSTRALLSTLPAVRITSADNQADIRAYCSAVSKSVQAKFTETDAQTAIMVEAVTSKANGMCDNATRYGLHANGERDVSLCHTGHG